MDGPGWKKDAVTMQKDRSRQLPLLDTYVRYDVSNENKFGIMVPLRLWLQTRMQCYCSKRDLRNHEWRHLTTVTVFQVSHYSENVYEREYTRDRICWPVVSN